MKALVANHLTCDDLHSASDSEVDYDAYEVQEWPALHRIAPTWRSLEATTLLNLIETLYEEQLEFPTRTTM
jgi:hypothetical protein